MQVCMLWSSSHGDVVNRNSTITHTKAPLENTIVVGKRPRFAIEFVGVPCALCRADTHTHWMPQACATNSISFARQLSSQRPTSVFLPRAYVLGRWRCMSGPCCRSPQQPMPPQQSSQSYLQVLFASAVTHTFERLGLLIIGERADTTFTSFVIDTFAHHRAGSARQHRRRRVFPRRGLFPGNQCPPACTGSSIVAGVAIAGAVEPGPRPRIARGRHPHRYGAQRCARHPSGPGTPWVCGDSLLVACPPRVYADPSARHVTT